MISLVDTVEKLLAILNVKPHEIEIGIWGADNHRPCMDRASGTSG